MPVQFQPKSTSEIEREKAAQGVWPPGEYPFVVLKSAKLGENTYFTEQQRSKNGNDMIHLVLGVTHSSGHKRVMRDWIMPEMPVKFFNACAVCGLTPKYQSGLVAAEDFFEKTGFVKIGIEKDKTGQYDDRNAVKDYVFKDIGKPAQETHPYAPDATAPKDNLEDEIPF